MSYRRLLVPISGHEDWPRALELACSLAATRGAALTAAYVIEVSPLLPLDARLADDEAAARTTLRRAEAIADEYAVRLRGRIVRARDSASAIVSLAEETGAEVIVMAAPPRRHVRSRLGGTVRHVLAKATATVVVAAPPAA